MQFTFNEKIKKESHVKTYSMLLEGIGYIATFFLSIILVGEVIDLLNQIHIVKYISEGYVHLFTLIIFISIPAVLNFSFIYQYYFYLGIYYFFRKKMSPWATDTHFVQVNYYDSNKNLIFPKSRPYPHDIGTLKINKGLKFKGLDSSFTISQEEVLNSREFAFGRYQYIFKEQMTFIDLPFNFYQVLYIAISSIDNPIYWITKENNKELLDLIADLKYR